VYFPNATTFVEPEDRPTNSPSFVTSTMDGACETRRTLVELFRVT
jgi:hypothetical protein